MHIFLSSLKLKNLRGWHIYGRNIYAYDGLWLTSCLETVSCVMTCIVHWLYNSFLIWTKNDGIIVRDLLADDWNGCFAVVKWRVIHSSIQCIRTWLAFSKIAILADLFYASVLKKSSLEQGETRTPTTLDSIPSLEVHVTSTATLAYPTCTLPFAFLLISILSAF